jgi:hypothetical protein
MRPNRSDLGYLLFRRIARPKPPESVPKVPMNNPRTVVVEEIARSNGTVDLFRGFAQFDD